MTQYNYANGYTKWTIFSTSKPDLLIKDLPPIDYLVIVLSALDTHDSAKLGPIFDLILTLKPQKFTFIITKL